MAQLSFFGGVELEKEDVVDVMKELTTTCDSCRLAILHPVNKGFCYRGSVNAKIAVLYEAPRDVETERGAALLGHTGKEFERWMRFLKLDTQKEVFIVTAIHCQPPKVEKNGEMTQRPPEEAEIRACFGPRTLRVLRALPNLEVIITLGWPAATVLLGGDPKQKTHEAQWFETSLLPGIPVFCLPDPGLQISRPSPERAAAVQHALEYFRREFMMERKVVALAVEAKGHREEQGLGLL
jgi:DNA polymerase